MIAQNAIWRSLGSVLILVGYVSSALCQTPAIPPAGETNPTCSAPAISDQQVTLEVVLAEIRLDFENGLGVEGV